MSEEIALAAADLATVQRLTRELAAAKAALMAACGVIEAWAEIAQPTPLDLDLSALAIALGDWKRGAT